MTDTGTEGPRLATRDDFPGILDLVDRCFGHSAGGMAAEWCHVYDEDRPERHGVVRENGRVVSHISVVEDELVVGDGTLRCWGITGVATDPRYRGQGHMSALMDFWTDRMDEEDVPFAKLGGDRQRYGRWGWERAGREHRYRVTPRYLDREPATDIDVERYDGAPSSLDLLDELYRTKRYRVERDRPRWRTRLDRVQFDTLLARGPDVAAYLVFSRTRRNRSTATVSEVAGDERAVRALFGYLFDAYDRDTIQVNAHARDPLTPFLSRPDVSGSWHVRPNRMVSIRRLPAVLRAYRSELERQYATADVPPGEVTLGIDGDERSVALGWDGETVTVEARDTEPTITLDRMAMTRGLFGDPATVPAIGTNDRLAPVLPLPYYVPLLDRV